MALQRPYGDDYTSALPSTLEAPTSNRTLDDASIVLSMETQLSSLYAERSQLQTALGVSDAAEVIALVGELRAKSERVIEPRPVVEANPLPDPLEQRITGARRSLSSVVAAQQHCESECHRVDSELARLEAERVDLEANLARVATQRTEMERNRTNLQDERRQLEQRMGAVESLMEQLDQVLGAQS